jgi:hypothetical protein
MWKPASMVAWILIAVISCVRHAPSEAIPEKTVSLQAQDSLAGSFHIVYDPGTRYFLVSDSASSSIELVFSAHRAGDGGSLLAFDRKRVSVIGKRDSLNARVLHVTRLSLLEGGERR